MQQGQDKQQTSEPLVEIASDETVVRALQQSAHPVEFTESNRPAKDESGSGVRQPGS
jgi:hypothetical protein